MHFEGVRIRFITNKAGRNMETPERLSELSTLEPNYTERVFLFYDPEKWNIAHYPIIQDWLGNF